MARVNYGFEKRQKEIKRKQKADAKLDRRRAQREEANQPPAPNDAEQHDGGSPAPAPRREEDSKASKSE